MLAPRVIPCLDIDNGRVVKGVRFQNLRDAGDPVASSVSYEIQGADEIILLDVSATPERRAHSIDVVADVRRDLSIPLTVGGGVRSVSDARRLLDAGADRVGVNTAAVSRPELITELSDRFGAQCVVIAVDAAIWEHGWRVMVRSGSQPTGLDVIEWCRRAERMGAGEILLTSWDRDGTGDGYDLDLIDEVSDSVDIPLIASGGADSHEHMAQAIRAGASAVLAASILHDERTTVASLKAGLAAVGIGVRL
jgi:imidazoleglycerol phosphate synthase cyclase subunit